MAKTPQAHILYRMFGDDSPIGSFEVDEYSRRLAECKNVNDVINTICDYAKSLHVAQADYEKISPFGGCDIDVENIDDIAFSALNEQIEKNRILKGFTLGNLQLKLANRLMEAGESLESTERFVKQFEYFCRLPEKTQELLDRYLHDIECFKQNIQQKAEILQNQGQEKLDAVIGQLSKLKSRILFRLRCKRQYKELNKELQQAKVNIKINNTDETVLKLFSENLEYLSRLIPYVCLSFYETEEPEFLEITDENDVKQACIVAAEYTQNKCLQERYLKNCSLLDRIPLAFN